MFSNKKTNNMLSGFRNISENISMKNFFNEGCNIVHQSSDTPKFSAESVARQIKRIQY